MAWTAEQKQKMVDASEAAIAEFDANVKTTKAGKVSLPTGQWIVNWISRWKQTAGYRRLCRHIIQYTNE
jgi:hypothetical protein